MEQEPNTKNNLIAYCMKYGLITGFIIIIIHLLFYFITGKLNSAETYAGTATLLALAISLYYFGRQYRNEFSPQYFSYGAAFKVSFLTGLFASILVAFFFYIFCKYNPEIIKQFLLETQKALEVSGIAEDDVETMIKMLQNMMTAGFIAFSYLLSETIRTLFISLFIAIFNKKTLTGNNSGMSQFDRDMSKI